MSEQGHGARLRELDSLRGIAALAIVLWHYVNHFHASPYSLLFEPFYRHGHYAVDFFFVLSGFVLSRAYLNERRRWALDDNLVRRIARIYPLHFVTLLLVAAGQLVLTQVMDRPPFVVTLNDGWHFSLNLALSQAVGFQEGFSFNAPSWSISTELWVNLLFFALLATTGRWVVWGFGIVVLSSLYLHVDAHTNRLVLGPAILSPYAMLLRTSIGFFVGTLLYQVFDRGRRERGRSWVFDFVCVGVIMGLASASWARILGTENLVYLLSLAVFPLFIYATIRSRAIRRALHWRPLTYLGDISYSLYLIHFPVQLWLFAASAAGVIDVDYDRPDSLLVFVLLLVVLSGMSHRFIELPLQRAINAAWHSRRG